MTITNGIKIVTKLLPAKAVASIRKSTGLSISEIQRRAGSEEYLIEKELSDDKSLAKMIELAEDLAKLDVEVELFQGGYNRPLEFMKNVYQSHRETAKEIGLEE